VTSPGSITRRYQPVRKVLARVGVSLGKTHPALSGPLSTERSAWPTPDRFASHSHQTVPDATGCLAIPRQTLAP
jgi:hypothetical protein